MSKCVSHGILPPCQREGEEGDWWKEQHVSCTGSHHLNPDQHRACDCACHRQKFNGIPFPQYTFDKFPLIMNSATGSGATYEDCVKAGVIHDNNCGNTECGLDFIHGIPLMWTRSIKGVTCPDCLRSLLLRSWETHDEGVVKPIRKFLIDVGDEREFASECEIAALIRIALKHPDEWKQDGLDRVKRMEEDMRLERVRLGYE